MAQNDLIVLNNVPKWRKVQIKRCVHVTKLIVKLANNANNIENDDYNEVFHLTGRTRL